MSERRRSPVSFSRLLWMFVLTDITKSSCDVGGEGELLRCREWNVQMVELSWFIPIWMSRRVGFSLAAESVSTFKWENSLICNIPRWIFKVHESLGNSRETSFTMTERSKVHRWFQCHINSTARTLFAKHEKKIDLKLSFKKCKYY